MAEQQNSPWRIVHRIQKFFTEDLWIEPLEPVQSGRHALRHLLRFATHVVDGFCRHRLAMRAAWLSYTSLLALVPLLAVALSITKGLLQRKAEDYVPRILNFLVGSLAPQLREVPGETVAKAQQEVVTRLQQFLANIDASTLGVSGVLILAVVAISLLAATEDAMNDIWGAARRRSWIKRVVYYWAAITLVPLLVFGAMAMTATAQFTAVMGKLFISPLVQGVVLTITPFVILWFVFATFYFAMPNTGVRVRPALIGGLVSGTLWQLNNLCAFLYMSRVLAYSKIYGALGLIPIFLIGLYFSWFILLLGAEVARATQHARQKPTFDTAR